jgi:hypothetical protein
MTSGLATSSAAISEKKTRFTFGLIRYVSPLLQVAGPMTRKIHLQTTRKLNLLCSSAFYLCYTRFKCAGGTQFWRGWGDQSRTCTELLSPCRRTTTIYCALLDTPFRHLTLPTAFNERNTLDKTRNVHS